MPKVSLFQVLRHSFPIALFLLVASHARATTWTINTVESGFGGDMGYYSSITLDAPGRPHIAYSKQTDGQGIRYATKSSGAWTIEQVSSPAHRPSIALDSQGQPRIAYRVDSFPPETRYARRDGTAWNFEFVDATGAQTWGPSLALKANGEPGIAFRGGGAGDLNFAYHTAPFSWTLESPTFFENNMNNSLSLALDSQGNPRIAFTDGFNMEYAVRSGGAWTSTIITNTGEDCSLALDSSDNPHISFQDDDTGDLKYAKRIGGVWTIESVDTTGVMGLGTDIALEAGGVPAIIYGMDGQLRFARRFGEAWTIEIVNPPSVLGYPSIAVDAQGRHHVTFLSGQALRYAVRGDPLTDVPPAAATVSLRVAPNPIGSDGASVLFAAPFGINAADLAVFDVVGRRVRTLALDSRAPSPIHWDGADESGSPVAPGVYFLRLRTNAGTETQRVSVIR